MHVCHCVNACKACGFCCATGHSPTCPRVMASHQLPLFQVITSSGTGRYA